MSSAVSAESVHASAFTAEMVSQQVSSGLRIEEQKWAECIDCSLHVGVLEHMDHSVVSSLV